VGPPAGADGGGSRPRPLKGANEEAAGILNLPVGIEDHAVILRRAKAYRQGELQGGPAGLAQHAARQASAQAIEFGLTHGPLASQQETIVAGGRVIQTIFIEHERASEGATFQEPMPVTGAPRQAGDL
jgi:hypothetical protein